MGNNTGCARDAGQLLPCLVERDWVAGTDEDVRTLLDIGASDGEPESLARSGDKRCTAGRVGGDSFCDSYAHVSDSWITANCVSQVTGSVDHDR